MGAWQSLEMFSRKGMGFAKLYPGGTGWLSTALVQSLVNRGQYEAALATADEEWTRSGSDDKQAPEFRNICVLQPGLLNRHSQIGKQEMQEAWRRAEPSVC